MPYKAMILTAVLAAAATAITIVFTTADSPPATSNPGSQQNAAVAPATKVPVEDEKAIQGHWVCVDGTENGKIKPFPGRFHAAFTDKEVKLAGIAFEYHLDPKSSPKRCPLQIAPAGGTFHAIYSLQIDTLKLALPRSSRADYPKNFAPAMAITTYVFRRAEKVAGLQIAPKPLSQDELAALKSLRKDLAQAIALLQAAKYLEFRDYLLSPEDRNAMERRKRATEDVVKYMKEAGPKLAKLLLIVFEPATDV